MEEKLYLEGNFLDPGEESAVYILRRSDPECRSPSAFARGDVGVYDGFSVIAEQYSPDTNRFFDSDTEVVGADSDFSNAAARLYRRMRRRAGKIAKKEGRTLEVVIESGLNDLIRGKK